MCSSACATCPPRGLALSQILLAAGAPSQGTLLALWRGWGCLRSLNFSVSCYPYLHLVYKMEIFSFRKLYNT